MYSSSSAGTDLSLRLSLRVLIRLLFLCTLLFTASAYSAGTAPECDPNINVINRVVPYYPTVTRPAAIEGYVRVRFFISADGLVSNAVVIESSNNLFNQSAIETIRKWKFEPPSAACWHTQKFTWTVK